MKKIIIAMALMAMTTTITASTKKDKQEPQRPPMEMRGHGMIQATPGCNCKTCKDIDKRHKKMEKRMKKHMKKMKNCKCQCHAMHKMPGHGAPAVMHSGRK